MQLQFPTTAKQLGLCFEANLIGNPEAKINRVSSIEDLGEGTLSYLASKNYSGHLGRGKSGVIFTTAELADPKLPLTFLVVKNPQESFLTVCESFRSRPAAEGISGLASIDKSARLGKNVSVGPFAVIGPGCEIGDGSILGAHAVLGAFSKVGTFCEIHPHVTILDHVTIGSRVRIFPGTVIGSDGFGLLNDGDLKREIPQIGKVRIDDNVRIGALVTIDRGKLGETVVGSGTKLDDQVHIGHNCKIGKNVVVCGNAGLSGSVVLEDGVVLGGQVGVKDHVTIGTGTRVGGMSGVAGSLPPKQDFFGYPALPIRESIRLWKYFRKLPQVFERLKKLEEKTS